MNDENERSVASDGSVAGGVVQQLRDSFAAAALTGLLSSLPNGDQYHSFAVERAWSLADSMLCERGRRRCPVSSQENLTLTDDEREALKHFAVIDGPQYLPQTTSAAATIRGLLERLGGGR